MPLRAWLARFLRQIGGANPFAGDCLPTRVGLSGFGRPSLPFPHPWNYREPLRILDTYFWDVGRKTGSGRHNRYLDVPGLPHVLVTREPAVIRAILSETGDQPGQFDRDTAPTKGIARATGEDTLLFANGALWRRQKKIAAPPFSRTTLFQPEKFQGFERTFRRTVAGRLERLHARQKSLGERTTRVALEIEINVVMHFGFGYGPRVCPGKFLGLLEVGLVVGAFAKIFRFRAVHPRVRARAAVSTKPADRVLVDLELR